MFGILGINLMKDKLGYCEGVEDYYGVSRAQCEALSKNNPQIVRFLLIH